MLPSLLFSQLKKASFIVVRARGFLEGELKSKSKTKNVEACKQGKNRERTSKTGCADELNRGYFDDMPELKQHSGKIALANKILIPRIATRKFPAVDVIYSDGRKSKLPIVFDASGVDASKLAVPEASLVCLSFRANSQAMVDSWRKPFYGAFSESKSVQLYEVLYFCYLTFHSFLAFMVNQLFSVFYFWLLCLNLIKRQLLQFMRKSSDEVKDPLQRHIVYSFRDHYYFRKELKILNLLTGMNKFIVLRDLNFVAENIGVEFFEMYSWYNNLPITDDV
ncbi:hypothetical protein J1N35_026250 [Gossypium stocksii]|uniref:Uncharacterized protein n=1 Tax=Gossypium stocksii TaxID=47602 RepID=A0A9D3ZY05_9ROSI|nr:hypothetical protein J1N35_026250 [Gossypium stocksii]